MAIDREALLDLLGREDKLPARGLVPPSLWADERYYGQADVPFDPKRALALLGMVGGHEHYDLWDIDLELTLLAPESSLEVARFIQAQWQEHLGLEVELTAVENGAYADRVDTLSPHAFLWLWYADYTSPYNFLGDGVGDIARRIQWSNLEFDQLVEEAFQEANQERRMALYSQAERILCETDVAIAPLYHYIYASP
jgi:ABC-type transport system substrate-binding protein